MTYPPLDCLKPVAKDIWIVDSGPFHMGPLSFPVRMTVVRLKTGQLWLHSPTRVTPALAAELDRIGPVAHLVAPNSAHWTMVEEWRRLYPRAVTWAAPHLASRRPVRNAGAQFDQQLGNASPEAWSDEITQSVVPGGFEYREVAFFHHVSKSLILTDLIVNLEAERLPMASRFFARVTGAAAPDGMAPVYLRMIVKMCHKDAAEAVRNMLALEPERVIFSHGQWYQNNGTSRLRAAMAWLLGSGART